MTYYSIKNLTTRGIEKCEYGYLGDLDGAVRRTHDGSWLAEMRGVDCFETRAEAVWAARQKLYGKIKALDDEKQRLERMFEDLDDGSGVEHIKPGRTDRT